MDINIYLLKYQSSIIIQAYWKRYKYRRDYLLKYQSIIIIQAYWKGYKYRRDNLPNSIRYIKRLLLSSDFKCSNSNRDGRVNSCFDEDTAITIINEDILLFERIFIPDKKRHWFDIAVHDYIYGWLPINIKSTTTRTADNTGNLAMCMYAITNVNMSIKNSYNNGQVYNDLIKALKNRNLNKLLKRDYYFVVINKEVKEVIINSFKGLSELTSNNNNLPFQVVWKNNKQFIYKDIDEIRTMFIETIQKPKMTWSEHFLQEIRQLE